MVDREAVRQNAKYLRNVRPVDPEEIFEYVEGQPHPAVVRQTLREEAFDLGLAERDDGTFVPVVDDPVSPSGWNPEGLPEPYAFALEDLLVERYGANWHRGESGDALRGVIRRLKEDYYRGNPVEYDETVSLGYALYHLPDYYAHVGYVLDELAATGRLPRKLRVLDVGAGSGGPALGLHDYLAAAAGESSEEGSAASTGVGSEDATGPETSRSPLVDYHAVEPSDAADVLERLLEGTDRNFRVTVHRETAEAFDPSAALGDGGDAVERADGFDLVLCCNVLSELDDPVAVVERSLDALAPDGSLVATAPADRNTSTGLRRVERAVAPPDGDVTVYSPTLRLWPDAAPADRGWSFDVRPDVDVPAFQRRLDEAGDDPGTFTNVTVQYSYAILRRDGARRFDVRADPARHAKMADMERHVTQRIDLLAVKLSHDLSEGDDANPLFKVGDGSEQVDHYAVLTRESGLNRGLREAPYGAVLALENALALWNDDEEAYNLVVDGETVVDIVAM